MNDQSEQLLLKLYGYISKKTKNEVGRKIEIINYSGVIPIAALQPLRDPVLLSTIFMHRLSDGRPFSKVFG